METHASKRQVGRLSSRGHHKRGRVTRTKAELRTGPRGPRPDTRQQRRWRQLAKARQKRRAAGMGKKPGLGVRKRRMGR